MQDKMKRLASLQESRLVILGGSNAAFGIHSPIFAESTGREVVNLGLHVSLGLEFPLRCYLPHAKPGDIVVVCPEYHVLIDDSQQQGDPVVTNQLIEQWPNATEYLDINQNHSWKQFLDHDSVLLAHQWVHRSIKMIRGRDKVDKIYRRSSFNQYGDLISHYQKVAPKLTSVTGLKTPEIKTLERTVDILNRFVEQCDHRGVTVYFAYPPFAKTTYEQSVTAIQRTERVLRERCKVIQLNQPEDNVYSDDCFFDSAYHLNGVTGEKQSRRLATSIINLQRRSSERMPEQLNKENPDSSPRIAKQKQSSSPIKRK